MSFFTGKPKVILGTSAIPIVQTSVPSVVTTSTSTPTSKTIYSSTYSYSNVPIASRPKVITSQNEYNYKTSSTNVTTNAYNGNNGASEFRDFGPSNGYFYETLLPPTTINNSVYEVSPGAEEIKKITYRPPMELYATDSFVIILMYLPGVTKENLNVELEKQLLKIFGKKEKLDIAELKAENQYHTKIIDRPSEYYFCNIFQLTPAFAGAGPENITCTLKDGELMIKIVANEQKQGKKVIKVES